MSTQTTSPLLLRAARPMPSTRLGVNGMTIIEIMVSFAIIAIAVSGILGTMSNLNGIRREAPDVAAVNQVLFSLVDRIQAANFEQIGAAAWSKYRYHDLPVDTTNLGPLTETGSADDSLLATGLISRPMGLNLRIFVEYYRGVTRLDDNGAPIASEPGIMDGETSTYTKPADFRAKLTDATDRAKYRLNPAENPWAQVGDSDPVVIRLIALYSLPSEPTRDSSIELITGRKK